MESSHAGIARDRRAWRPRSTDREAKACRVEGWNGVPGREREQAAAPGTRRAPALLSGVGWLEPASGALMSHPTPEL